MATALGRDACELARYPESHNRYARPRRTGRWSDIPPSLYLTEAARLWEERRVLLRTIRVLRVLSYDMDFACGLCGHSFGAHAPGCELAALLGRGTG
jgi:hypothetical protein